MYAFVIHVHFIYIYIAERTSEGYDSIYSSIESATSSIISSCSFTAERNLLSVSSFIICSFISRVGGNRSFSKSERLASSNVVIAVFLSLAYFLMPLLASPYLSSILLRPMPKCPKVIYQWETRISALSHVQSSHAVQKTL